MTNSLCNFKISEVLWRRILRNNKIESWDEYTINIKMGDSNLVVCYDYNKNIAKVMPFFPKPREARGIAKKYITEIIEDSKKDSNIFGGNLAGKELQRFGMIYNNALKSKRKLAIFGKQLKEAESIRDDLNFILERYNSDPRAPKDFNYYMDKFIKILKIVSPKEVNKERRELYKEIKWGKNEKTKR